MATSSIYGVGASVLVNTVLSPPFRIQAIGTDGLLERFLAHPAFLGARGAADRLFGLEFAAPHDDLPCRPSSAPRVSAGARRLEEAMSPPCADQPLRGGLLVGLLLIGQLRSQARPTERQPVGTGAVAADPDALQAANADCAWPRRRRAPSASTSGRGQAGQTSAVTGRTCGSPPSAGWRRCGAGDHAGGGGHLGPDRVERPAQQLRNAGAEAMAVDQIRITPPRSQCRARPRSRSTACPSVRPSRFGRSARRTVSGRRSSARAASSPVRAVDRRPLHRAPGGPLVVPATERDLMPRGRRGRSSSRWPSTTTEPGESCHETT